MDPIVRIMINSGYTDSPYLPPFDPTVIEQTGEYKIVIDCDGVTKKILVSQTDTSMPQFLRFPVVDRSDWAAISRRLNPGDAAERIGDIEKLVQLCADPGVPTLLPICGAFGHPRNLFGDENLSYLIYDDLPLLEEILDNWRDLYVELLGKLTERVRVDALLFWEDMCYRGGPLISPAQFRKHFLPRYSEVITAARTGGVTAIMVDTDGDCLSLIPGFLDVGVDCLMPFEVQAGMDVVSIGRQFPSLAIMGGLDKKALAVDRPAIRAEVDRVLPAFRDRGRFIPTLDHTAPPNISLAHYEYYLECVRRYEAGNQ